MFLLENGLNSLKQQVVRKVHFRCQSRIKKQAVRLHSQLQYVHGLDINRYVLPDNMVKSSKGESTQDVEHLGRYCDETHQVFMRLCEDRMRQLKDFTAEIATSSATDDLELLIKLSQLAYSVRHSSSFKHFVQANVERKPRPGICLPTTAMIIDRLGKISRFYRASLAMTDFVTRIKDLDRYIVIEAVVGQKIQISELSDRTGAQLCARAGYDPHWNNKDKFGRMLKRWKIYRQHAEIQLIVFYEENPHIQTYSNYIGCNKQACYLCFNFIKYHARFEVDGCHQSLYSLWTVKENINFSNLERAQAFQSALKNLSLDVRKKFEQLKATRWQRRGFTTANESVPNLSRISLLLTTPSNQEVSRERSAPEETSTIQLATIDESTSDDHIGNENDDEVTRIDQMSSPVDEITAALSIRSLPVPTLDLLPKTTPAVSLPSFPSDHNPAFNTLASRPHATPTDEGLPGDVFKLASENPVLESDVIKEDSEAQIPSLTDPPSDATSSRSMQTEGPDIQTRSDCSLHNAQERIPIVRLQHDRNQKGRQHRRLRDGRYPSARTTSVKDANPSLQEFLGREKGDSKRESRPLRQGRRRRNQRYEGPIDYQKDKNPRRRRVRSSRHRKSQRNSKEPGCLPILRIILRKIGFP